MRSIFSSLFFLLSLVLLEASADKVHGFPKRPAAPKSTPRNIDDDKYYWDLLAQQELNNALSLVWNTNVARNVIMFLGDGMGVPTVTAARIYEGQSRGNRGEEGLLAFEAFPHVGLSKTYNVDYQVPDSAGTGTAYLTGVKTNMGVIGFDARVERGLCETITNDSLVYSIAQWSLDKGKRAGVVTSTRITHATPANIYAHLPERYWECDAAITQDSLDKCPWAKDAGRQLVEDSPGNRLNVIMGGGYQMLDGSATSAPGDPVDEEECIRADGRRLWQEWIDEKQSQGVAAAFVRNRTALNEVDLANTEYLMGIFANNHLAYEHEKIELGLDMPTLAEMTEAAITVLDQEPNGYFLLVEGGKIDWAHHSSLGRTAVDETMAMNTAIQRTLEITDQEETLIVVTADHSHTMTVNGYPVRGNPITGLADYADDGLPYTTMTYANGPGMNYTVVDGAAARIDLTNTNTTSFDYVQQAAAYNDFETHGGEDVAIYAIGPMAHLFHSVHEQNYIAHAMAYASCVDATERHCQSKAKKGT